MKERSGVMEKIISQIKGENLKKFRWFQEKAHEILNLFVKDYLIVYERKEEILAVIILGIILKTPLSFNPFTAFYYLPVFISKNFKKADLIDEVEVEGERYFIYDAVDSLPYVKWLNEVLTTRKAVEFRSGAKLVPYVVKDEDIYKVERLSNKSTNSLTYLRKDEIIKTYRKFAEGINPDLEMTFDLKRAGFENVQDIRGYFLYELPTGEKYTVAMVVEYIKNEGDMWQYTQQYLKDVIYRRTEGIDFTEYVREVKEIARIIGEMHSKLSFTKIDISQENVEKILESIKGNFSKLLAFVEGKQFDEGTTSLLDTIKDFGQFIFEGLDEFSHISLGKYMRCHGDLHLEQILKTERGYVIIDFEGEPTKPVEVRREKISPLKDVAGMLRSFSYAAYAAYFNYLEKEMKREDEEVEKLLISWEKEVEEAFIEGYLKAVSEEASDVLPKEENFLKVLALFKLDKALFEGIYEVNNRPTWFKIPLKGILECIEELKKPQEMGVSYG
ncbi:MAG: Uncharacterized protein, probably involved in trehalose biosynthesis [Caldanaerobacter subterraneus]|nr:MAG: Uncharacterized protein, probably involved in trehalose biosynthesis [Caldanaerobacter subterraneus]